MSSGSDFGVIDQYLNLRDLDMEFEQDTDSLLHNLDQKVPQFGAENGFAEAKPITIKSEFSTGLFPGYDHSSYLEELQPSSNTMFTSSITIRTQPTLNKLLPSTPLFHNHNSNSSFSNQSIGCTFVDGAVGSGCTVIQQDQQLSPPGGEGLEIVDLDDKPFYEEISELKPIKTEPGLPIQHLRTESGVGYHSTDNTAGSMESWLIETIRSEIQNECEMLTISVDPSQWSPEDVQTWVQWTCRKNNFIDDCSTLFDMRGDELCQLTEEQFRWRTNSAAGPLLHQQLDVWKMVCKLSSPSLRFANYPSSPYSSSESCSPPATQPRILLTPSTSPAPSIDSTCSTMSSSSSGAHHHSSDSLDDEVFVKGRRSKNPLNRIAHEKVNVSSQRQPKQTIHLWQFLRELLEDSDSYHNCIKWTDRSRGIFKIEDSSRVAKLWGRRKNRPAMNYDKLSRSVRQYYKKGIIKKTEHSKRLVYQFCPAYL